MPGFEHTQFLVGLRLMRDKIASFEDYPFNLPAVSSLNTLELHPKVTFLVGENGSGKSTLLEAIAIVTTGENVIRIA